MTTATEDIKFAAEGWARSGCGLPCEIVVEDWRPTPLCCSRPVVVMSYGGHGDRTVYLGEYDTRKDANRAAGQFRRALHAAYDRERVKMGKGNG